MPINIYLFGVLCCFQHCTGHITTGSFVGRGNQYIQLVKVLYYKLPTIGKQLPTFPHKVQGLNRRPQRWEVSVSPLHHHGPTCQSISSLQVTSSVSMILIGWSLISSLTSHLYQIKACAKLRGECITAVPPWPLSS